MGPMLFRFLLLPLFGLTLLSCAAKVNNLETAEGTYAEGNRLLEDEFFDEARKQFYRIKTEFPNSPLQAEADLRIADSYFEEESFPTAASTYEDFVRMYPGRPEVPYALYRAGMSYVEQMPSHPQRDTRSTEKAIDTFTRLLVDYPESEYSEKADKYIEESQNQLAQKSYQIARFYERQNQYGAAARRYGRLLELFPDHPLAEEAFARRIESLFRAEKEEEARSLLARFEEQYPGSKFRSLISK